MIPDLYIHIPTTSWEDANVSVYRGLVSVSDGHPEGGGIDLPGCKTVQQFLNLCELLGVDPWEEFAPVIGGTWPTGTQFRFDDDPWRSLGSDIDGADILGFHQDAKFRKLRGT